MNRPIHARLTRRTHLPVAALLAIIAVTVVWWAFALWPTHATTPGWVVRTRYVCFGDRGDGLPTAAGWMLLIGQPISMLGFLVIVWGAELFSSLRLILTQRSGRLAAGVAACALLAGTVLAAVRVSSAQAVPLSFGVASHPVQRLAGQAPALALTDQRGVLIDMAYLRGRPVVVAFAYAHCETICPLIVHDLNDAFAWLSDIDAEALIVTVDPWRDTPERLPHIARQWQLNERVHVLSGAVPDVTAVLAAWKVGIGRDPDTGEVTHTGVVYLVDRAGRLAYAMPAQASELVTLVRELAGDRTRQ